MDDITASFKAEYSDFDVVGRQIETLNETAAAAGPFTGLTYAQILVGAFGAYASVLNNTLAASAALTAISAITSCKTTRSMWTGTLASTK